MRRRLIGLLALALLAAACTAGGGGDSKPAATLDPNAQHDPMTLTVWSNFSGREFKIVTSALESIRQKYPWMTVKHVGGKDDPAIIRATNGGTPPDMAISFTPANSARYCQTGAMQDLNPYLANDKVDKAKVWPPAIFSYTQYENVQCVLPMLTDAYGLYYNKDLLAKKGITEPPRTLSELADAAKKLTEYNPDGSIKVAGYMPLLGFYSGNTVNVYGRAYDAKWYDDAGKPSLSGDPNWAKMLQWQKSLVDEFGYEKLQKFAAKLGGGNSEWSAAHGFETGKIAMMIDGEWRTAFIAADKSKVNYATAPPPTADDHTDLYGSGQVGGTIIGIPKGVKHAAESWLLVKYMATDSGPLTTLARGLRNVPSTNDALQTSELASDPQFKTFMDIFRHPKSTYKPLTPIGQVDEDLFGTFGQKWQAGKVPDLQSGLQQLDTQIAKQLQLG
jgi:multiple sugar transport system substrate-binding protein